MRPRGWRRRFAPSSAGPALDDALADATLAYLQAQAWRAFLGSEDVVDSIHVNPAIRTLIDLPQGRWASRHLLPRRVLGYQYSYETAEDTMTTTPGNASSNLPGKPPVVDLATWQAAREELLAREKAHTRDGDAIAAARRRLPMVELDGAVEVTGAGGPVPFLDLFQGRDELVVYKHMWYDGAPYQGQCEGCTLAAWALKDAVYLNARGVSFAIVTTGRWDEVAPFVQFMGYTQPWYSVRDLAEPVGGDMGQITCFLRDGDRAFLTYSTTGRGNEAFIGAFSLLDMTPYGRREAWQDNPEGWPEGNGPCWYWRSDAEGNATWGPTGRPVPQWTRPGATPEETLGRHGQHH